MNSPTNIENNKKIAYLAPAITALSATFVYKEILGLEANGYKVIPFSVHHQGDVAQGVDELNQRVRLVYNKNVISFVFGALKQCFISPKNLSSSAKLLINDVGKVSGTSSKIKLVYQFLAGLWLAEKLKEEKASHLHIHFGHVPTQIGMYAAQHANIPFSFMVHANDLFQRALLYPEKGQRAAAVTTISNYNVQELTRVGVPKEKIHIVRCGINPEEFIFKPKDQFEKPVKICVVARLVEKKGIDTLVNAANLLLKKNIKVKLEIAGDGPESESLQALVSTLGLSDTVTLIGRIENKNIPDWFAQQDIFILPARVDKNGDMDGIPVVLMEAMSQGMPVISTKISGIPELVIDKQTGVIVTPDNPEELAEAIVELIDNHSLRKSLIENARAHVIEEFEIETNIKRLARVLESCERAGV